MELGRGSYFDERIENNGFGTSYVGENIVVDRYTSQEALDSFIDSPHHCENIMNANFEYVGIALYDASNEDSKYDTYWTHDYGG